MLENLYFDFEIEPAMCARREDKAASTEMKARNAKPLIYSYSTGRQHSKNGRLEIQDINFLSLI